MAQNGIAQLRHWGILKTGLKKIKCQVFEEGKERSHVTVLCKTYCITLRSTRPQVSILSCDFDDHLCNKAMKRNTITYNIPFLYKLVL